MNSLLVSWKTSLSGVIAGGLIVLRSIAGFSGVPVPAFNPDGTPKVDDNGSVVMQEPGSFSMDTLLLGLGLMGIGAFARDGDKSSEDTRGDK